MQAVCSEAGWCGEVLLLPSLLVMKIFFQESTSLGRAQHVSRVKWIPKQHVLAPITPFLITQVNLKCQYLLVK